MTDAVLDIPDRDKEPQWLQQIAMSADPEGVIREHCKALVAAADKTVARPPFDGARALEILLVGYNGAGNLGADVRVAELARQIAHLLAPVPVVMRIVTMAPFLPESLFPTCFGNCEIVEEQIANYVPLALDALVREVDVVLVCEGSMFKSTFSDTLSSIMFAAVALARRYGKFAMAVGAEAGTMTPDLEAFACEAFGNAPILARNARSCAQLRALGLNAMPGADTAWSIPAVPGSAAEQVLSDLGQAPGQPVTIVCPINPFWWPVKIDLPRAAQLTEPDPLHYGAGFFHADSPERRAKTAAYLDHLAAGLLAHQETTGSLIVVLGMERIDALAVDALAERLGPSAAKVLSGDHPPEVLVALLRKADLLVSSRFHAVVLAAGGGVPAIGVSLDERIATLLRDAGAEGQVLSVDGETLARGLGPLLERTWATRDHLSGLLRSAAERELAAQERQGWDLRNLLLDAIMGLADGVGPISSGLPPHAGPSAVHSRCAAS